MDIARVKREKLSAPELVKTSLYLWGKMFWPCLKIFALAMLAAAALATLWIVFTPDLSRRAAALAATTGNIMLLVIYFILTLAVFRTAYDIIITKSPSVIDAIDKSLRALPKMLIAAAAGIAIFLLLIFIKPGGGPVFLIAYGAVVSVWCAAALLYLGFYTMALLLRGSGIFATFKFCFLMLRGKWASAFFRTLLGIILTSGLWFLLAGILLSGLYLVFFPSINAVLWDMSDMGAFSLFYHAQNIWLPILLAVIFVMFADVLAFAFLSAYMTALFLNIELSEEANPAADKVEITPAADAGSGPPPEFTEFFQNSKPIDVTERIIIGDDLPAIAPATREEALREFGHNEEEDDSSFKSMKDILTVKRSEDDILEVLTELSGNEIPPDENLPSSIINPDGKKK